MRTAKYEPEASSNMSEDRPGTPAAETLAHEATEGATRLPATHPPTTRRPLVIVDDDAPGVARIARILAEADQPVITATSGRSALRQVIESGAEPGLLICAIEMPEMSGIELAARLTAARPEVRVLLMSADPRSVERARERLTLVHGVLLKPFTPDELGVAVAAALAFDP